MKFAALFILAILAVAAKSAPTTQEEAQAIFDAAVSSADEMVISAVSITPGTKSAPVALDFVPAWQSTDPAEVSALSHYFRLRIPPSEKKIIDGKETMTSLGFHVGGYPSFAITLKKKEEVLLFFAVWRSVISCEALVKFSAIRVDEDAEAPFYSRVMQRLKEKRANQTLQRTAPSGRG